MILAVPNRVKFFVGIGSAVVVADTALLYLRKIDPNDLFEFWEFLGEIAVFAALAGAVVLWLAQVEWRGAAVRQLIILSLLASIGAFIFKDISVFFGAHDADILARVFIGTPFKVFLLYGFLARREWARVFTLVLAATVAALAFLVVLAGKSDGEVLALAVGSGFLLYWMANPEVKKEFV